MLHGHKHIGHVYWDHIHDVAGLGISQTNAPHRVLVVSGPSLPAAGHGDEICRLLDLQANPFTPNIVIQSIKLSAPGSPFSLESTPQPLPLRNWRPDNTSDNARTQIVSGQSASEIYERVLALFDVETALPLFNVVCHIADVTDAEKLPTAYPEVPGITDDARQAWFKDLVSWWQRPKSAADESLHFTHGSRIRAFHGDNQLERVIALLSREEQSSRGVISLLDPQMDRVDQTQHKFPSFCSVQFIIRRSARNVLHLDCTGYFRKQEIRYWWPVNVAEIALLQKEVRGALVAAGKSNLQLGSLTTVAAIASIDNSPPQVLVPILDRALDEDRNSLWAMVYALFRPDLSAQDRAQAQTQWENGLSDLIPAAAVNPDGVPVSIAGVRFVLEQVNLFASHHPGDQHEALIEHLGALLNANTNYLKRMNGRVTQPEHTAWRNLVEASVRGIQRDVRSLFAAIEARQKEQEH